MALTFDGGTDYVETASISLPSTYSICTSYYITGSGGSGFGRLYDHGGGLVLYNGTTLDIIRLTSSSRGLWQPSGGVTTSQWYRLAFSQSGTSDPTAYLDGSANSLTRSETPSGTEKTSSARMYIGNRSSADRGWDGRIADFAVWNVTLSADELKALSAGCSALAIRPSALVVYLPMIRNGVDRRAGGSFEFGTAVGDHPRIWYPHRQRVPITGGGGAPATTSRARFLPCNWAA